MAREYSLSAHRDYNASNPRKQLWRRVSSLYEERLAGRERFWIRGQLTIVFFGQSLNPHAKTYAAWVYVNSSRKAGCHFCNTSIFFKQRMFTELKKSIYPLSTSLHTACGWDSWLFFDYQQKTVFTPALFAEASQRFIWINTGYVSYFGIFFLWRVHWHWGATKISRPTLVPKNNRGRLQGEPVQIYGWITNKQTDTSGGEQTEHRHDMPPGLPIKTYSAAFGSACWSILCCRSLILGLWLVHKSCLIKIKIAACDKNTVSVFFSKKGKEWTPMK